MKKQILFLLVTTSLLSAAVAAPSLGTYPAATVSISGDVAVTPSAAPTNTTRLTAATSPLFKGRLEGNPISGVVRVTNANPAGVYTVTVTAFDSMGATAKKTFQLTVTTPVTCTPVSFPDAVNIATGSFPVSVAVGDFDRDGVQDLAVVNQGDGQVAILLGDGAGGFGAPDPHDVGSNPMSVAVGDFNGDGKQDLVVANLSSASVSVLLGDGAGGFGADTNINVGFGPSAVVVGDFDGDGNEDIALSVGNNLFTVLLGDGTGGFGAPTAFGTNNDAEGIAIGDFNGDGKQDVAVVQGAFGNNPPNNVVSIFLGDGTGGFGMPTTVAVGNNPRSATVGDFNDDGQQDLATANNGSGDISVLLGDGTGNFSAATNFTAGGSAISIALADFDGNGEQDLVTANFTSGSASILLGDGLGGFGAPSNFTVGDTPFSVAVGDFDGDGKQDIVTANLQSGDASVLLRQCLAAATTVQFSAAIASVNEGNNNVVLTVTRTGDSSGTSTVHFATADGSAKSGSDYTATSGDLTFAPGVTSRTFSVPIIDDSIPEGNETFTATLSAPGGGASLGMPSTATVTIIDNDGSPTPSPTPATVQLLNISGRSFGQLNDQVSISGFIVSGAPKQVAVRGIGPTLGAGPTAIANPLPDPMIELHDGTGAIIQTNDNWRDTQETAIQASGLAPSSDLESALIATLAPGPYTAILRGVNNSTGVGLVEVYDLEPMTGEFANVSVRAATLTDDNVLINGLILSGAVPKSFVFRAIGPELADRGISGELLDPMITVYDGNGVVLGDNDNWEDSPDAATISADGLAPTDSRESALLLLLTPGNYTAIVEGADRTTGIALAEVYKLD